MEHTTLNLFDLVVFAVLGLSGLMAFFRGFVREVLSLGAWVGATLITIYAFPAVGRMLEPHVKSTAIANGFAGLFTFMGALIIISVITGLLRKLFKAGNDIGLLDNGLGLMFGLLRGVLLVAVAFFVYSLTVKDGEYPEGIKYSLTLPYVEASAAWVGKVAPDYLEQISDTDLHPDDDADDEEAERKYDHAVEKANKRTDEIKDHVEDKWPSMNDLKDTMNNASDSLESGGY